jgi:protein-tyrosine phosphatase
MGQPRFVDCHSHVVPSGDDGAETVAEGVELCRSAARHGTRILFATPHVWPHLTLPHEREAEIRRAFEAVAAAAPLELRLGYELTPTAELLEDDPRRYLLDGTDAVLMEVPFTGPAEPLVALAEHVEAAGLRPVIAHPERTEAVLAEPDLAAELAERGWLLQVNGTSLLGRHGTAAEELAWSLLEDERVALVGSDGHRATRPAHLDEAFHAVAHRVGEEAALPLFDGTALGLATVRETVARTA